MTMLGNMAVEAHVNRMLKLVEEWRLAGRTDAEILVLLLSKIKSERHAARSGWL